MGIHAKISAQNTTFPILVIFGEEGAWVRTFALFSNEGAALKACTMETRRAPERADPLTPTVPRALHDLLSIDLRSPIGTYLSLPLD